MAPTWGSRLGVSRGGAVSLASGGTEPQLQGHPAILDPLLPFCFARDLALILGLLPAGEKSK